MLANNRDCPVAQGLIVCHRSTRTSPSRKRFSNARVISIHLVERRKKPCHRDDSQSQTHFNWNGKNFTFFVRDSSAWCWRKTIFSQSPSLGLLMLSIHYPFSSRLGIEMSIIVAALRSRLTNNPILINPPKKTENTKTNLIFKLRARWAMEIIIITVGPVNHSI